jgi:hypothetical protein
VTLTLLDADKRRRGVQAEHGILKRFRASILLSHLHRSCGFTNAPVSTTRTAANVTVSNSGKRITAARDAVQPKERKRRGVHDIVNSELGWIIVIIIRGLSNGKKANKSVAASRRNDLAVVSTQVQHDARCEVSATSTRAVLRDRHHAVMAHCAAERWARATHHPESSAAACRARGGTAAPPPLRGVAF